MDTPFATTGIPGLGHIPGGGLPSYRLEAKDKPCAGERLGARMKLQAHL